MVKRAVALACAVLLAACASVEPAAPIVNRALSAHSESFASAVPMIAINPRDERNIVVVWRTFSLPLRPRNQPGRTGVCTASVSFDGGDTFENVVLPLTDSDAPACNAPFVRAAPDGSFYAGASAFAWSAPSEQDVWVGRVALARSDDGGMNWRVIAHPIGTETRERFAPGLEAFPPNTPSPWDGARAAVDPQTRAVFVSGAKAIAPTENDHAQRYITVSHDEGRTFGTIHAMDSGSWPERWDGSFVAAHGVLAFAYIGAATPLPDTHCPCATFALSRDGGATFDRRLVAQSDELTTRELVHYPQLAAHPQRGGVYALTLVSADRRDVKVMVTEDEGATWRTLWPRQPEGVSIVSRPGLGYAPTGALVVAWRGMTSETRYDVYAAALDIDGRLGGTVRVSTETSTYPPGIAGVHLDGGDFVTWASASRTIAHFAWPDARDASASQLYYTRVPLRELLRAN